ncbi:hypothetical protein BJ085DRAFT_17748 [Dimargaris cristalligena]|uniref:RING-type domain-containing protein n=1 Tax=Dimargaris cristalligena TaxID=215637 RepID=A0A4P9ZUJ6_9FUNG|nr:hypothetical protein BJ085DRAFT_17748 [Dimargaris cristalligena]|eukprot:RKP37276.1 hypothetical protein BJ085DRAFT_17748 [Dimargaris cristalligena]
MCGVCSDDFQTGELLRRLPCRHAFHATCIDPWLTKKCARCPLCRTNCTPSRLKSPGFPLGKPRAIVSPSHSIDERGYSPESTRNMSAII